jgi:hypothetical protein
VIALPLCPIKDAALLVERDMFLLQTLLLLRDSDLRKLRPHHVNLHELPGVGQQLILTIHQDKTTDEVRVPLAPLAADATQATGQCSPSSTATATASNSWSG